MRKYSSVLALANRAAFYKIALILAMMAAVQIAAFCLTLGSPGSMGTLEEAIDRSHVAWISAAAFAAICAVLAGFPGSRSGSVASYTVRRLSVSEKEFAALCCFYNACCLILLTAVQLLAVFVLCAVYLNRNTEQPYDPAVFLAFYRSPFLHGLLPLGDAYGWIRNLVFIACTAVVSACTGLKLLHGREPMICGILAGCVLLSFSRSYGEFDTMQIFAAPIFFILIFVVNKMLKGADDDEA